MRSMVEGAVVCTERAPSTTPSGWSPLPAARGRIKCAHSQLMFAAPTCASTRHFADTGVVVYDPWNDQTEVMD